MSPFSRGDGPADRCIAAGYNSDMDDGFAEDMEALRRACMITGKGPDEAVESDADSGMHSSESDEILILQNIRERFSIPQSEMDSAPVIEPLSAILPSDSDEDDFETLRAIQRRFQDYQNEDLWKTHTQLSTSGLHSNKRNDDHMQSKEVPTEDFDTSRLGSASTSVSTNGYYLLNQEEDGSVPCHSMVTTRSHFPKSCQMIVDALKKNRSSQRFIRNMLIRIEGKLGENKDLQERVKHLIDYQNACKRRAGLALSQKKDPRVKLISLPNSAAYVKVTRKTNKLGPEENSHVCKYKMVMQRFPVSINKLPWSPTDTEKLVKGVKQQYLEALMLNSMGSESGELGDSSTLCLPSTGDCDISSEEFRSFLPLVNWERLAIMYFKGRTGAECQTRWLNSEDPLINNHPWTKLEEKALLAIAQERGIFNWINIAVKLGTSRTPFQCLVHYQRSLNAHILKKDWTQEEDAQLRTAVEMYGEDWQLVASNMEGRSGNQCSNRWRRTLHPDRLRVGRWLVDEDKRLKAAVMLFGPKNWNKIAKFSAGRTQVQCRERWMNCLNPALNLDPWTEEEDIKLKESIMVFGYCWSKIASVLAPRTDNQCRRRWMVLFPNEVSDRKVAWKVQKAALRSNFVDREKERPLIGPDDFCPEEIGISTATSASGRANGKRMKKSSDPDRSLQLKKGKITRKKKKAAVNDQTVLSVGKPKKKRKKHLLSAQESIHDINLHIPQSPLSGQFSPQVAPGWSVPSLTGGESSALSPQDAISNSKQTRRKKRKSRKRLLIESCDIIQNMPPPVVAEEPLALGSGMDYCYQVIDDEIMISENNTNRSKMKKKYIQNGTLHSPREFPVATSALSVPPTAVAISPVDLQDIVLTSQSETISASANKPGRSQQCDPVIPCLANEAVSSSIGCMDMVPFSVSETTCNDGVIQNRGRGELLLGSSDDEMKLSEFISVVKKEMKKRRNHYCRFSPNKDMVPFSVSETTCNDGVIQNRGCGELLLGSSDDEMKLSEFISVVKKEMKKRRNHYCRFSPNKKRSASANEHGISGQCVPIVQSFPNEAVSSSIGCMNAVSSFTADTVCDVGAIQNGDCKDVLFGSPDDDMKLCEFIAVLKKEKKEQPLMQRCRNRGQWKTIA